LVTGASRGIGRATALALAEVGAQVLVHYSRAEKEADAVAAEIRRSGGRAEKVKADLALKDGPHQLADRESTGERTCSMASRWISYGPS
jgi:NAD(P)-dependent dehydrogenase (short-subunit alcohol dehydrogenase family)